MISQDVHACLMIMGAFCNGEDFCCEHLIVVLGNRLFPIPKNESPQELDHQALGNEKCFPQHNEQGALGDKLSPTNT